MNYDVVEVVIDRLVSTFGLNEWAYDIEDLVEDIAEGLKHIGAQKVYYSKRETLTVNGKIALLPLDCQNITQLDPITTYYKENGNYLIIDKPDGTNIDLIYQAIPLDVRGYPVVPDNVAVREALIWYMAKRLILNGLITKIGYQYAEQEWQWRCGSARGDLNSLSMQDTNRLYNDFVRLNPLKDQYVKNFVGLGKENTLDRTKLLYDFRNTTSTW